MEIIEIEDEAYDYISTWRVHEMNLKNYEDMNYLGNYGEWQGNFRSVCSEVFALLEGERRSCA